MTNYRVTKDNFLQFESTKRVRSLLRPWRTETRTVWRYVPADNHQSIYRNIDEKSCPEKINTHGLLGEGSYPYVCAYEGTDTVDMTVIDQFQRKYPDISKYFEDFNNHYAELNEKRKQPKKVVRRVK